MRELWFVRGGVRLFAVEDGSGPVLVVLHGPMASHEAVRSIAAPLASQFRVFTPDLRGSGRSRCGESLTFDRLADDVAVLLDHVGAERAVIGGVSGGSGVALRFALRYPDRTCGLVLVQPPYAGEDRGYTPQQQQMFAAMDDLASRAIDEGVQVLRPLYGNLPDGLRERALATLQSYDAASIVASSRFIASGAQPFRTSADLESLRMPVLLVRGDDAVHPAAVSDLYAMSIPECTVLPAAAQGVPSEIAAFCERCCRR